MHKVIEAIHSVIPVDYAEHSVNTRYLSGVQTSDRKLRAHSVELRTAKNFPGGFTEVRLEKLLSDKLGAALRERGFRASPARLNSYDEPSFSVLSGKNEKPAFHVSFRVKHGMDFIEVRPGSEGKVSPGLLEKTLHRITGR